MSETVRPDERTPLKVEVLPGAASLSQEECDKLIMQAEKTLNGREGDVVQCHPPSPLASVILKKNGVRILYLGLALEVIQAMQKSEKD